MEFLTPEQIDENGMCKVSNTKPEVIQEDTYFLKTSAFEDYEKEGARLVLKGLPLPAYDCVLKLSHCFNVLEARGSVSVTERAQYIARVRGLAKKVINCYLELENVEKKEFINQR